MLVLGTGTYKISLEVFLGSLASEDFDFRGNLRRHVSVFTMSRIFLRINLRT